MRGDRLLGVSFGCFVGLGMADASLGTAWPHIRSTFGVRLDALGLLLVLFFRLHLVGVDWFPGRRPRGGRRFREPDGPGRP